MKKRKRHFICTNCAGIFYAYVKNDREKTTCPICPEDEEHLTAKNSMIKHERN